VRLIGKRALVTGSSRGIGKAIALEFASQGANITVTYVSREEAAHEVVESIKAMGCDARAIRLDVTRKYSVIQAFDAAIEWMGGLDVLVNNAGVNEPEDFCLIAEQDWDRVLDTNLKGPFLCGQKAFEILKSQGTGGSIINITSVSGQYGGPRTAHYCASKAGLIGLTHVMARFGAKMDVRVNAVSPGLIESEMAVRGMAGGKLGGIADSILLGRLGTADEAAKACTFLASDDSSYVTAQVLNVNGGIWF